MGTFASLYCAHTENLSQKASRCFDKFDRGQFFFFFKGFLKWEGVYWRENGVKVWGFTPKPTRARRAVSIHVTALLVFILSAEAKKGLKTFLWAMQRPAMTTSYWMKTGALLWSTLVQALPRLLHFFGTGSLSTPAKYPWTPRFTLKVSWLLSPEMLLMALWQFP